jgi:hypothetical protein
MSSRDTSAARALLAHYNSQIAGRRVRRLLKSTDEAAWKRNPR